MEGAWKLRVPVRLVETNQSSVSSREDCVTQLLVNFQLKTKPIDNVSAFCLLNSIICSCLLLDKNNHFSIGAALHGDTYDSFFESETHERYRCWPAALQARPASVWCFQQSVYQPVTAELEADGKDDGRFCSSPHLLLQQEMWQIWKNSIHFSFKEK